MLLGAPGLTTRSKKLLGAPPQSFSRKMVEEWSPMKQDGWASGFCHTPDVLTIEEVNSVRSRSHGLQPNSDGLQFDCVAPFRP